MNAVIIQDELTNLETDCQIERKREEGTLPDKVSPRSKQMKALEL